MAFDDFLMDAKLHIETTGRDETCSDAMILPYEPTSYSVLDRLADSGLIDRDDHLIDYGSGKGRVAIYIHHRTGCRATGIEFVRKFHEKALKNLDSFLDGNKDDTIGFINVKAQDYVVDDTANRIFFFNPFHFKTLKRVMKRILESYERSPRHIMMFFYYPQDAYIAYLSSVPEIMFYDEIDCTELFDEEDYRNRIMIYETMTMDQTAKEIG